MYHCFNRFLENEPELKNEIISDFTDFILPFWQKEVEEVVGVEEGIAELVEIEELEELEEEEEGIKERRRCVR